MKLVATALLLCAFLCSNPCLAQMQWKLISPMKDARSNFGIAILPNKKVLVTAGRGNAGVLSSTEIYTIATDSWSVTGSLHQARQSTPVTKLLDGKLYIASGLIDLGTGMTNTSEIYDPASGTWDLTTPVIKAREGGAAILLPDGTVLLVAGLEAQSSSYEKSCEIFNPAFKTQTTTDPISIGQFGNVLFLDTALNKVTMISDHYNGSGGTWVNETEEYNLATQKWSISAYSQTPHGNWPQQAVQLPNGEIVAISGGDGINHPTSLIEVYSPANQQWRTVGNLPIPRYLGASGYIGNGLIIVTGGYDPLSNKSLDDCEIIDTKTWAITPGPKLNESRHLHRLVVFDEIDPAQPCSTKTSVYIFAGQDQNGTPKKTGEVLQFSSPILSSLILSPSDTLDFGSQTFCNLHTDSLHFSLSANGCDDIHITGMYFEPDTGAAGQFQFTPISAETIGSGKPPKQFTVFFTPKTPGEKRGWIIIESDHGTDTIALKASIRPGGMSLTSSVQHIVFANITSCLGSNDTSIVLTNKGCDTIVITDTSGFSVAGLAIVPPLTLPLSIAPGKSVSIRFRFSPPATGHYQLHPKAQASSQGETQDISLDLQGTCVHPIQLLASQNHILFDSLQKCNGQTDTLLTLRNIGCDTLRITQGPGILSPNFNLLPPFTLPIVIPPDSGAILHFRFSSSHSGNYQSTAQFHIEQGGLSQDIPIQLEGNGSETGGILSYFPNEFAFAPLSICAQDSAIGFVTNTGCNPIYCSGDYKGDLDFLPWGIGGPGTFTIYPGDTLKYKILLKPNTKGVRQGYIWLRSDDHSSVRHDTIPVTATILDGTPILSVSETTLDFGTTTTCSEHDSTFTVKNSGCDTLWITGFDSKGTGFTDSTTFPFFILPEQSRSVTIHTSLDTTGHIGSNSSTITITSNAKNPIAPVVLIRNISYPKDYTISFTLANPTGKNGDRITMQIIADSLPPALYKIEGSLSIGNTDLLTFIDYSSPNTVSVTGNTVSIIGNPIVRNGNILADLHFKVLLTKDSNTSVFFSNIILNDGDADYENCVARVQGASTDLFSYDFSCGEKTVAKLLRGELPTSITSIYPNPATGTIRIDIASALEQEIELELYNELGNTETTRSVHLSKGKNTIDLDCSDKATGIYSIRIGGMSRSVIVGR